MNDEIAIILTRLEVEEFWYLDSMRYSVTLDEAALACVGITSLNSEGEEDQDTTYGEVLHTSLLRVMNSNIGKIKRKELDSHILSITNKMVEVREIYINMREDLKEKDKTLELDDFKTQEKGRPYVTRTSVHAWVAKHLQKNLVGWQIKQAENQTGNEKLVDVKPDRDPPIASAKNQTLVIGALAQLWVTAVGAPTAITKGDKQPNADGMAKIVEKYLDDMKVKKLTSSSIRQIISPCIKALNESDGVDSQEFIKCVKDGLQRIEDESPIRR
ncbi:hypothetical protein [Paraglaciecola sp. MB-3u-78]|uniref:hypothetical protein n=1 Tax=Paraglaciecola sp. MB-3u-78 TaxID=2058332 RepID=UPI000C33D042|nr:hypothetical protein [Paraglaciecola sp. MB-3u-78]PKG93059.1 hypothetical protein CXF95_29345 [Paraglaciecola sp. MB-3u-78]